MRRFWWLWIVLAAGCVYGLAWLFYPTDRTPKGAYYRVATAVNKESARELFPYLETAAQHAAFTLHKYSADAVQRIDAAYPQELAVRERERFVAVAKLEPGPGVFEAYAERFGWLDQLRRDLSGVANVEVTGERATVETVRGTRYAFRLRDNGMWGLTLFTARLVADAEKIARDYSVIDAAASDYERVSKSKTADPLAAPLE
jgi:hypothetical protein